MLSENDSDAQYDNGQDQVAAEEEETNQPQVMTEDEWLVSWVKLQPGQPQVLGFSTDTAKRKMISKDFGKGPVNIMVFMVTEPTEPEIEKEFRVTSKNLARTILGYINKGITELELTKHGTGMKTTYDVKPVQATQPSPQRQKRL